MASSVLKVVQLTDLHLYASPQTVWKGFCTYESLRAVVTRVKALTPHPDLLLITGDLSQDETPTSYENIKALIAPLGIPTYWIPGNHDQQFDVVDRVLSSPPFRCDRTFSLGNWRFILLNSVAQGQVYGELAVSELDWLEQQLMEKPVQPTIISIHHHPVPIQSDWMDQMGLKNAEALFGILDRFAQVKSILFGHIHQAFATERQGVHYLGCPSTCMQFTPQHPDMKLDEQFPGFRQLHLYADGSWETAITRVPILR